MWELNQDLKRTDGRTDGVVVRASPSRLAVSRTAGPMAWCSLKGPINLRRPNLDVMQCGQRSASNSPSESHASQVRRIISWSNYAVKAALSLTTCLNSIREGGGRVGKGTEGNGNGSTLSSSGQVKSRKEVSGHPLNPIHVRVTALLNCSCFTLILRHFQRFYWTRAPLGSSKVLRAHGLFYCNAQFLIIPHRGARRRRSLRFNVGK